MPGKPITDQHWILYMCERKHHNQAVAAARAGMSERTARRHEKETRNPSERKPERGRTVAGPLAQPATGLRPTHARAADGARP